MYSFTRGIHYILSLVVFRIFTCICTWYLFHLVYAILFNTDVAVAFMSFSWMFTFYFLKFQEKKEKIWPNPMTKAPTPTEKSKKKSNVTPHKRHQKFAYTTIAELIHNYTKHYQNFLIMIKWHRNGLENIQLFKGLMKLFSANACLTGKTA